MNCSKDGQWLLQRKTIIEDRHFFLLNSNVVLFLFHACFRVEKKSRPEATVKDVPKPKIRPPSAAPKLDASKYDSEKC